jgi:hypothetical protein
MDQGGLQRARVLYEGPHLEIALPRPLTKKEKEALAEDPMNQRDTPLTDDEKEKLWKDALKHMYEWTNKSIWIVGEPGTGKSQWAHYVMAHLTNGDYLYCKGTLAALRHLNPRVHKGIIFDDIDLPNDWTITDYNTLVDYESDGYIKARYNDVYMPPQLYKIFLSNPSMLNLAKHPSVTRRYSKFKWENGRLRGLSKEQ